jgi:hypothetical protein
LWRAFDGLIRSLNRPKCVTVAEEVDGKFREREIPAYRLAVANALWAMKDYPFNEAYQAAVRDFFDAELGVLDFVNAPEPSRKTINDWVDQKTQQKIRELLPQGTIQEDAAQVRIHRFGRSGGSTEGHGQESQTQGLPGRPPVFVSDSTSGDGRHSLHGTSHDARALTDGLR